MTKKYVRWSFLRLAKYRHIIIIPEDFLSAPCVLSSLGRLPMGICLLYSCARGVRAGESEYRSQESGIRNEKKIEYKIKKHL